jgi:hypothetical protein
MRFLGAAVLSIAAAAACADPLSVPRVPVLTGTVNLVAPSAGAAFAQNDPSLGCPSHPFRGYGFRTVFDWEDVEGATRYAVRLKHTGSIYAAIDYSVTASELDRTLCNAFVADHNVDNWVWRVAAIADVPDAAPDTLWSEERLYRFELCRHPDGAPCTAPPEPAP